MRPAEFRTARLKLGLTQSQAGEALGLSKRQVMRMENGHTPIRAAYAKLITIIEPPPDHGPQSKETKP